MKKKKTKNKGIDEYKCECPGHYKQITQNDCVCSPDDATDISKCSSYLDCLNKLNEKK